MESKTQVFRARDSSWKTPLVRVEVDKVSESSVWIRGRRVAKASEGTRIDVSFDVVKTWLCGTLERQIQTHEMKIRDLKSRLAAVEKIEQSDCPLDNDMY